MIKLDDVWYKYPKSDFWVLKNVSLTLPGKGLYFLLGPNGSGKTTLLKIMGLLYKPQKGTIQICGKTVDWKSNVDKLRRCTIYVHETPVMFRGTVRRNIEYPLLIRGVVRREQVEKTARLFGIEPLLDKPARNLSRGQQQLVALARALAPKPKILLLDEPFSHLGWNLRKRVIDIIMRYSDKALVLVATHDTYLAKEKGMGYLYFDEHGLEYSRFFPLFVL